MHDRWFSCHITCLKNLGRVLVQPSGLDSTTRVTLRIRLRTRISDSTGGDVISRLPKAGRSCEWMKGDNRGSRSSSWNSRPSYLCHVMWIISIWPIWHYMILYGLGVTPLRSSPAMDGVRHHSLCMSLVAWSLGKANLQTVLFPGLGLGMFRKTPGKLVWRSPILSSDGLTTRKSCRQDWLRTIFYCMISLQW